MQQRQERTISVHDGTAPASSALTVPAVQEVAIVPIPSVASSSSPSNPHNRHTHTTQTSRERTHNSCHRCKVVLSDFNNRVLCHCGMVYCSRSRCTLQLGASTALLLGPWIRLVQEEEEKSTLETKSKCLAIPECPHCACNQSRESGLQPLYCFNSNCAAKVIRRKPSRTYRIAPPVAHQQMRLEENSRNKRNVDAKPAEHVELTNVVAFPRAAEDRPITATTSRKRVRKQVSDSATAVTELPHQVQTQLPSNHLSTLAGSARALHPSATEAASVLDTEPISRKQRRLEDSVKKQLPIQHHDQAQGQAQALMPQVSHAVSQLWTSSVPAPPVPMVPPSIPHSLWPRAPVPPSHFFYPPPPQQAADMRMFPPAAPVSSPAYVQPVPYDITRSNYLPWQRSNLADPSSAAGPLLRFPVIPVSVLANTRVAPQPIVPSLALNTLFAPAVPLAAVPPVVVKARGPCAPLPAAAASPQELSTMQHICHRLSIALFGSGGSVGSALQLLQSMAVEAETDAAVPITAITRLSINGLRRQLSTLLELPNDSSSISIDAFQPLQQRELLPELLDGIISFLRSQPERTLLALQDVSLSDEHDSARIMQSLLLSFALIRPHQFHLSFAKPSILQVLPSSEPLSLSPSRSREPKPDPHSAAQASSFSRSSEQPLSDNSSFVAANSSSVSTALKETTNSSAATSNSVRDLFYAVSPHQSHLQSLGAAGQSAIRLIDGELLLVQLFPCRGPPRLELLFPILQAFDGAISEATADQRWLEAGLANEAAGRALVHLQRMTDASHYIRLAFTAFQRWGAVSQCRRLLEDFPAALVPSPPVSMMQSPSIAWSNQVVTIRRD